MKWEVRVTINGRDILHSTHGDAFFATAVAKEIIAARQSYEQRGLDRLVIYPYESIERVEVVKIND